MQEGLHKEHKGEGVLDVGVKSAGALAESSDVQGGIHEKHEVEGVLDVAVELSDALKGVDQPGRLCRQL